MSIDVWGPAPDSAVSNPNRDADKIMKVARYVDCTKITEVNISQLARDVHSAIADVVRDVPGANNLHWFKEKMGIPDIAILKKNLEDNFKKWNIDCLEKFTAYKMHEAKSCAEELAKELGIELENLPSNVGLAGGSETI